MIRHDLLALTRADLEDISNRGMVKRAHKFLEKSGSGWDLVDDAGDITVRWSDGPVCRLPAGKTVAEAECDCLAIGMCWHLVRSVLAYQREHADVARSPAAATAPWSPGEIDDAALTHFYSRQFLASLRRTFDDGLVVEVVRSAKPVARFHRLRHTIRYLVEGDVRYSQCDCSERAPCRHAALGVWAFRLLADDEDAAIVTTGPGDEQCDAALLGGAEESIRRILETGVSNTAKATMDRLGAVEKSLREEGVVWPAEILFDLRRQFEHYHAHDARFSPDVLADLVGELVIRLDALRAPELPVPALFVSGDGHGGDARLGQSRWIGLGCGVRHRRRSVELRALMQDDSSGTVAAVARHFPDPEPDDDREPEDLSRLALKLVVKGRDLATIGAGQLVIKKGKLRADHRLALGRSTASVYAQSYAWEDLRPPVAASGYAEVRARLAKLPPASLRPRRLGEDMHVVRVAEVQHARFSSRRQAVVATLVDANGTTAELFHPYTTRNRYGTERLLNWLHRSADSLVFVAGPHRLAASGLVVSPTGIVFETRDGRVLLQPWVDDMDARLESADVQIEPPLPNTAPLDRLREDLAAATGDTFLLGVDAAIGMGHVEWDRLESLADSLNLSSIATAIDRLRQTIEDVDHHAMSTALLDVAVLCRLAQELG